MMSNPSGTQPPTGDGGEEGHDVTDALMAELQRQSQSQTSPQGIGQTGNQASSTTIATHEVSSSPVNETVPSIMVTPAPRVPNEHLAGSSPVRRTENILQHLIGSGARAFPRLGTPTPRSQISIELPSRPLHEESNIRGQVPEGASPSKTVAATRVSAPTSNDLLAPGPYRGRANTGAAAGTSIIDKGLLRGVLYTPSEPMAMRNESFPAPARRVLKPPPLPMSSGDTWPGDENAPRFRASSVTSSLTPFAAVFPRQNSDFAPSTSAMGSNASARSMADPLVCNSCHFVHRAYACESKCPCCGTYNATNHQIGCRYKHLALPVVESRDARQADTVRKQQDAIRQERIEMQRFADKLKIKMNEIVKYFSQECQRRKFNPQWRNYRNPQNTLYGVDVVIQDHTVISGRGNIYASRDDARTAIAYKAWQYMIKATEAKRKATKVEIKREVDVTADAASSAFETPHVSTSDPKDLKQSAITQSSAVVHNLPGDVHPKRIENILEQAIATNVASSITFNLPSNVSEDVARAYGEAISRINNVKVVNEVRERHEERERERDRDSRRDLNRSRRRSRSPERERRARSDRYRSGRLSRSTSPHRHSSSGVSDDRMDIDQPSHRNGRADYFPQSSGPTDRYRPSRDKERKERSHRAPRRM